MKMERYNTKNWKTLVSLQNQYFSHIDILTITGFMNKAQFETHVLRYITLAADIETKK